MTEVERAPVVEAPWPATTALIRKAQGGERTALGALFARYYPRVHRIVRARMGVVFMSLEDPEDIVQDTFIVAIEKFDGFEIRENAALINWLARLAEHQIQNAVKRHRALKRDHRREVVLTWIHDNITTGKLAIEPAISQAGVVDAAMQSEEEGILEECLHALPEQQREVILLRMFAGGSWEWIANELERPTPAAARELFNRARLALAQAMRHRIDA
jgi:RNA polymerase sigma-70 factor (ECF subfamily)